VRAPPYPAPPACKDPSLGARAAQVLGRTPPPLVATHLMECAACRIQRVTYSGLDMHAVPPSPALRDRLRGAARDR
jgi:hypothetical protein